jgi:putative transposase
LKRETQPAKVEFTTTQIQQANVSMNKNSTKTRIVNFHQIPAKLWRKLKKHLPKPSQQNGPGRPRVKDRDVINGIWYVLWSGCQWKAVKREWFHVSSSTLHERFQTWRQKGVFDKLFRIMVKYYAHERRIGWKWQSVDSKMVSAPLGGGQTGKNPTDRGKSGAKIHILVDERGAPLSIHITGANEHDKWSVDDLVIHMVMKRPHSEQHFCADKGYDYEDVHQFVEEQQYQPHIKHRRLRNEPKVEECPIPGEKSFPARRWVVERTLSWLAKRRSIKIRWCKKPENWLAFLKLASADILLNLIFG